MWSVSNFLFRLWRLLCTSEYIYIKIFPSPTLVMSCPIFYFLFKFYCYVSTLHNWGAVLSLASEFRKGKNYVTTYQAPEVSFQRNFNVQCVSMENTENKLLFSVSETFGNQIRHSYLCHGLAVWPKAFRNKLFSHTVLIQSIDLNSLSQVAFIILGDVWANILFLIATYIISTYFL